MQVSCFDCTLRACGLFKPITTNELGAINEIKRDHVVLPAVAEIIRAGEDCPEIYTLYSGWAFRFKMLSDGRRQIFEFPAAGRSRRPPSRHVRRRAARHRGAHRSAALPVAAPQGLGLVRRNAGARL